ncbi:hypothetical protein AAG570_009622 [Ranatra chinensis]|uniref:Uncharacterized protein n=1 Tax=Ranatra chinensis TaxID=642074 RepID=A0ABD0YPR2_9HEMI
MASKRRNMFQKNKTQETTENGRGEQGELFLRLGGEGSCLGEKRPLGGIIFQENLTGRRPEEVHRHHLRLDHKNITNAKINSTAHADESARLLLVGKSVHVGSCNLLQEQPQVAPPFLTVEKLHYKRIPPLNHNINTLQ